jgi:hypothetical protein
MNRYHIARSKLECIECRRTDYYCQKEFVKVLAKSCLGCGEECIGQSPATTQFRMAGRTMRFDYEYYADGRLKQLVDLDDQVKTRGKQYDDLFSR